MNEHETPPTRYGTRDGFDYDRPVFTDSTPIPAAYVVAYGVAHFQGPDGYLWFAPNGGGNSHAFSWGAAQNMAECDHRWQHPARPYYTDPQYRSIIDDLCHAYDLAAAADRRYTVMQQTPAAADPLDADDLRFLRHCLGLVEQHWREVITDAETAAHQPQQRARPTPGHLNIEPTPDGYRAIADRFRAELQRVHQVRQRLSDLLNKR
jgi:hypothetical protein